LGGVGDKIDNDEIFQNGLSKKERKKERGARTKIIPEHRAGSLFFL
jgi:hypothetical protein